MNAAFVTPRGRVVLVARDVVMIVAVVLAAIGAPSAFAIALAIGVAVVLAWGYATLHFPRKVTWDDVAVTFAAHGRAHTFAWRDVRVHVRRFLVKDRVFVRFTPSSPWRGRYWLLAEMRGFDALLRELDARAQR